jgi:RimJ/RimL family protein N-acetyltransferase
MSEEHAGIVRPILIEGQQIVLRDLRLEDVTQAYVDWMNDPEVVQYTESRFSQHTLETVRSFVRVYGNNPGSILFGIFSKEKGIHVGNIKLGPVNWYHGLGDLALIIGNKAFWGRGVAPEAIAMASRYAFDVLHLSKVTAGCYSTNKASEKAFLKAGFSVEAVRPQHYRFGNQRVDGIEMGLLNPDLQAESKP